MNFIPYLSQFGIIVNYYKQLGIIINNDLGHKIQPPITTGDRSNLHPKVYPSVLSRTVSTYFSILRSTRTKFTTSEIENFFFLKHNV
jgi:hypothetical protein